MYKGSSRLLEYSSELTKDELVEFNFSTDTHFAARSIELDDIFYLGEWRNGILFPSPSGLLIIKGFIGQKEVVIFNSQTDGYNGVTEFYYSNSNKLDHNYEELMIHFSLQKTAEKIGSGNDKIKLIICYTYSIDDHEFDALVDEIGLKSSDEINDLYSYMTIYHVEENQLKLLTEVETQ